MGVDDLEDDPSVLVEPEAGSGPRLFFTRVPEPKTVKNRVHWHVRGDVRTLEAHGATRLGEGDGLVTLADPEGNEFCVLPTGRRAAVGSAP